MSYLQRTFFLGGIVLQLFLAIASLQHKGLTCDESPHFAYGLKALQGSVQLGNVPEMPFSALNALFSKSGPDLKKQVLSGRYVTVFFLLALSVVVFLWSRDLYGNSAAIFSLYLTCLDPNLMAHGHLVTCDIYAAFTITLALYCFWKFIKNGGYKYAILSASTLGISQLAKYTSLGLYPVFIVIVVLNFSPVIAHALKKGDFSDLKRLSRAFLRYFSIFLLINILIINLGYGFYKTFTPLKDYSFESRAFQWLQATPAVNAIPIPLPYPYIQGMDILKFIGGTGDTFGKTYLLGHLHDNGQGFNGYYLITIIFKTPIASLCIILIALVNYWRGRRRGIYSDEGAFLLGPVLFYLIFVNFLFNMDLGIRYILFIFPLLYVFSGSLFVLWEKYSLWARSFFILLVIYLAVSVFSYFPHYISYFNELVANRKMAYKILVDSNLDWGGDGWYLKEYLKQHPGCILSPSSPRAGRIIVGASALVGRWRSDTFGWLRDNFKPVDQIAYSYLVFDVKEADLKRMMP